MLEKPINDPNITKKKVLSRYISKADLCGKAAKLLRNVDYKREEKKQHILLLSVVYHSSTDPF